MKKHSAQSENLRQRVRENMMPAEAEVLRALIAQADPGLKIRRQISADAADLVQEIRDNSDPGLMEVFLGEYGLSTDEGVALMCLAEALLRVPDAETIDALIEDKIAPSNWGRHLGASSSPLVNASTWALLLTGKVLRDDDDGMLGNLRGAVKRLGEPVIRTAVSRAMKEMGRQFVLGRDIDEAIARAKILEADGYTYSYDMLGEAARTEGDAKRYHLAYSGAIGALASACTSGDIRENPGISVKLSALHPRFEYPKRQRVLDELVPRTRSLALLAKSAGMGFNIDAEEANRLDLSLEVIEAVVSDPSLKNWDGFGVVVQAYGPRAAHQLDWLYDLATRLDRKIMVRLVKGAYWDTEIKTAQMLGLDGFPVFTRKASTDVSYITNAAKLLGMTDRIYPQFATHNAHTVSAILHLAKDKSAFEFQRLHGMGENLHATVMKRRGTRCRIYAPVGAHRDLLAYLVRRLLENGANSSFVNQIVDEEITPQLIAADPFEQVHAVIENAANPGIARPPELYSPDRRNSRGWDITDPVDVTEIAAARKKFRTRQWQLGPLIAGNPEGGESLDVINPADHSDTVGSVQQASPQDIDTAIREASDWHTASPGQRAKILVKASDLFETHAGEFFALAAREAGKTLADCIDELREAVDFLRFYAGEALRLENRVPRGIIACISPWNFPLAIFTGQISAALAAGNGVLCKPAEATPLIALRAVELMHEAGVPRSVLQLLPGKGSVVGARLSSDPRIAGLAFTGSLATARHIHRAMAAQLSADTPLIAETGGLNAMLVDSTALPEQAVRDIIASAFQSAGQRCSALRILYVQEDVADTILEMLEGAMDELSLGDPWQLASDIGPVIDKTAHARISTHIETARSEGRLMKMLAVPESGTFIGPTLIRVNSIRDLGEEIFGPVLHVAEFSADQIDTVIDDINRSGFGLTFGLHTRIDDLQQVVDRLRVGNIYVNRNQIGAVVGSQPFGGEGLSGTGPKAGGPNYVARFAKPLESPVLPAPEPVNSVAQKAVQKALDRVAAGFVQAPLAVRDLPGPTGESNRLSIFPRGVILCLGPDAISAAKQHAEATAQGCAALAVAPGVKPGIDGVLPPGLLADLQGFDGVCYWGEEKSARKIRQTLAARSGPIISLITESGNTTHFHVERHVCVDTTASGGNAALLAAQG